MNEETVLVHNGLTMSVILVFELTSPYNKQTGRPILIRHLNPIIDHCTFTK